jgi:hypothetical protein
MIPAEIVKSLRCCAEIGECEKCPIDAEATWDDCRKRDVEAADMIERLTAENAALREKQRWIPVTERMPEVWRNDETKELVNYMIYSPDFGVDIGNYHAKAKKWLCMALPCTVTYWMPLPEAPEEGGKA